MGTQVTAATAAEEADAGTVHADAIRSRDCVSAECVNCAENFPDDDYVYHFDTRGEMLDAISQTDWRLGPGGLRCTVCAPDGVDTEPENLDWIAEASCFTIQCTRCRVVLESDCGEAHFPSIRAAAEAALSARWMVSAHRVWCRGCTALVSGGHTATATSSAERHPQ